MKRLLILLLAAHAMPVLGQYQYYGGPSGGMGAMPTMPPAPPPVTSPPTYPAYGDPGMDMGYGSTQSGYGDLSDTTQNIINYGYLGVGYLYQKPKNSSLDGSHGLGLSLSAQLFKPLFIKAGFGWSISDGGGSKSKEYDFTSASLGTGLYLPITSNFHFIGEVGGIYGKLDADRDRLSFTEGAVYARPAIRFAPVEYLELQAGVTVTSSDSFDSMIFDISAFFRVLSHLDIAATVDLGDEFTGFTGGLRVRW